MVPVFFLEAFRISFLASVSKFQGHVPWCGFLCTWQFLLTWKFISFSFGIYSYTSPLSPFFLSSLLSLWNTCFLMLTLWGQSWIFFLFPSFYVLFPNRFSQFYIPILLLRFLLLIYLLGSLSYYTKVTIQFSPAGIFPLFSLIL